jgi:hypothetical protein
LSCYKKISAEKMHWKFCSISWHGDLLQELTV